MRTEKKFNPKKNLILKNFNPKKKILYKRRRWFYVTMVVMDVCPAKGVLAETITSPHCRRNEINRKQLRTKARKKNGDSASYRNIRKSKTKTATPRKRSVFPKKSLLGGYRILKRGFLTKKNVRRLVPIWKKRSRLRLFGDVSKSGEKRAAKEKNADRPLRETCVKLPGWSCQ